MNSIARFQTTSPEVVFTGKYSYQGSLTSTVFTDNSKSITTIDNEINILQNLMISKRFCNLLATKNNFATWLAIWKSKAKLWHRTNLSHFGHFFQHFYSTLNLSCLRGFIPETFNKTFYSFSFFILTFLSYNSFLSPVFPCFKKSRVVSSESS